VRNNQSLAHDNPMLNHDEAMLIFRHVAATIRFLRDQEKRFEREERAAAEAAATVPAFESDDEIPF
jgi:hypothetical protein